MYFQRRSWKLKHQRAINTHTGGLKLLSVCQSICAAGFTEADPLSDAALATRGGAPRILGVDPDNSIFSYKTRSLTISKHPRFLKLSMHPITGEGVMLNFKKRGCLDNVSYEKWNYIRSVDPYRDRQRPRQRLEKRRLPRAVGS